MQDEFDLHNLPAPGPEPAATPEPTPEVGPEPEPEVDTRPIWPGRLEMIYKEYLAQKARFLAKNPMVQDYRQATSLEEISKRICRDKAWKMPPQRLNLETKTFMEGHPHWTNEEVMAWLDYEQQKEDEQYEVERVQLQARGGRFSGGRGILQMDVHRQLEEDRRLYRFV